MENSKQKPQKPPLSPARIAGEILAGAVGAIVGLAPLLSNYYEELIHGALSEWAPAALLILPLTYPIGFLLSILGVYLVGNTGSQTGSFGSTLLYSLGATAALAVIVLIVSGAFGVYSILEGLLFAVAFLGPTLGAVIGFNMTRRYKTPPPS